MAELDQQFIEYVVKNLVDHPDDIQLERTIDDRGVLLKLSVHPDDMGKIIGKAGSTAKAIRTLLRVVGAKTDERLNLKIVDREGGEVGDAAPAVADDAPQEATQSDEAAPEQETTLEDVVPEPELEPDPEPAAGDDEDVAKIKAKAREGLDDLNMDL